MNMYKKFFSLFGAALVIAAAVCTFTSCKSGDDSDPAPVATITSEDGSATLSILTLDKATGTGTYKVTGKVGPADFTAKGDFVLDASGTKITLKNTKVTPDAFAAMAASFNGEHSIDASKKVTVLAYTFNLTPLFA